MTDALKLSAFIISLNEAKRIGATLESLKGLADEIIVVDSGSTDGTQQVAESYGAKVIHNDWPGYGPQKRFAEEQCKHDWVLNLDADEVLSEALIREIREIFQEQDGQTLFEAGNIDGYILKIRDCVPGEKRPRKFAHMTRAVRLYNKSKGRYADSTVHDRVQFDGSSAHIHTLSSSVYHYSVTSMEQVIDKLNRYSTMQADDMQSRGRFPSMLGLRVWVEFPVAFFKSYILRADILRGSKGFTNSIAYAFSRFARIAKVIEKKD